MTAHKYTDHGVTCDYPECWASIWGSELELNDGMTIAHVRKLLRARGWVSVKRYRKMDQTTPETLDYCPAHAKDVT